MTIKCVAFDVAGTTVQDGGVVISAFKTAFETTQPELWESKSEQLIEYAQNTMGQSKVEVFTAMLGDVEAAIIAERAFEEAYFNEVAEFGIKEIPGASELFATLRSQGIKVSLNTGFTRATLDAILTHLGWRDLIDFSITPAEAGAGRPDPAMLMATAKEFGIIDPSDFVVLGDTVTDIQTGKNFGASKIIGVLTGAHKREALLEAGASSVINSVADLPSLL